MHLPNMCACAWPTDLQARELLHFCIDVHVSTSCYVTAARRPQRQRLMLGGLWPAACAAAAPAPDEAPAAHQQAAPAPLPAANTRCPLLPNGLQPFIMFLHRMTNGMIICGWH